MKLFAAPTRALGTSRHAAILNSAPHYAVRTTRRVIGYAKSGPTSPGTEDPSRPETNVSELAKAALADTIKGEKMTAKDVFGEGTLKQLRLALGEARAGNSLRSDRKPPEFRSSCFQFAQCVHGVRVPCTSRTAFTPTLHLQSLTRDVGRRAFGVGRGLTGRTN
jgi:hypothetical protein